MLSARRPCHLCPACDVPQGSGRYFSIHSSGLKTPRDGNFITINNLSDTKERTGRPGARAAPAGPTRARISEDNCVVPRHKTSVLEASRYTPPPTSSPSASSLGWPNQLMCWWAPTGAVFDKCAIHAGRRRGRRSPQLRPPVQYLRRLATNRGLFYASATRRKVLKSDCSNDLDGGTSTRVAACPSRSRRPRCPTLFNMLRRSCLVSRAFVPVVARAREAVQ